MNFYLFTSGHFIVLQRKYNNYLTMKGILVFLFISVFSVSNARDNKTSGLNARQFHKN